MKTTSILFLAASTLAAPSTSQIQSTVGPPVAPVGCPIQISISNDTQSTVEVGPLVYIVTDANGDRVFPAVSPILLPFTIPLDPGSVHTTFWDQVDANGNPVAPGSYEIHVALPAIGLPVGQAVETTTVQVSSAAEAAVAALGTPRVGTTRNYHLCSPGDANEFYLLMAAASSNVGFATCAGIVPLDPDSLLLASLSGASIFPDWFGQLDGSGESRAPAFVLPQLPALVGFGYSVAFVVLNSGGGCFISTISEPTMLTIE